MTKLWLPNGNSRQIEIDMQIAILENQQSKAKMDLILTRKDLVMIEQDLSELKDCLDRLKATTLIVSIGEYEVIKQGYAKLLRDKDKCLQIIRAAKKSIEEWEDKKKELLDLRDKVATKILRFDDVRAKRSKDRD